MPPFDLAIVFMAGIRAFDEGQLVLHEEQIELSGQVGGEVIVANLRDDVPLIRATSLRRLSSSSQPPYSRVI
jgi:hypothetical protein